MKNITRARSLGLLALGVAVATQSIAQEAAPASLRTIEEIVVTATRREENAQIVPVSVNVFSSEMLADRSVHNLGDLTRIAPGIRFVHQGGGGNMNVVLRGLSRIPIGTAPNAVITYFAEIPLDFAGSNITTYDLASVQVLKGPQGTLFGRNAIGGAVVITPQAPTYDFGGYIKGSAGNYDHNDVEGAINIPLVDNIAALRLAGKVSRRDGYTRNMGSGRDMDDVHKDMFRVSLLLEPTENLRNTTVVDYSDSDEAGPAGILSKVLPTGLVHLPQLSAAWNCSEANPFNPAPCTGFNPDRDIDDALVRQKSWGPDRTSSEFDQVLKIELLGVSNRTEWDIGPVTLRNFFGYRSTEVLTDLNTDGVSFAPNIITASSRVRSQQLSDELHLFGKAFDEKLNYLVGAFWISEEPDGRNGGIFTIASPVAPWVTSYTEKTNKALFAQVGYNLLENLKINLGYRYNETDQEVCSAVSSATNFQDTPEPSISESACPSIGSVVESEESAKTWNIGLDWQVNDNIFAYITHRKGYREGGINSPLFDTPASSILAPFQTYEPETLKDIEIGLKTDFNIGDIPVRFNLAVYRGEYDGVVNSFNTSAIIPATDPGSPLSSSVGINTGKRTLSGFESELVVELLEGLTLTNTAAYVHQKINEASLPPIPGLQAPSLDPASPEWSTSLALRWVLPFQPAQGELVFNADYYWQDSYFVANGLLPSYDVANLRLDWNSIGNTGVDLSFFMRNVMDDEYPYAANATQDSLGFYTFAYAEPRMYGLEVSYHFGR
ncbi:MAG: TonB-dependent receptor [Pseudomonadota bacterium]|nr:TonB-dependent receptor [Pseudomonadota bacterium]